MHFLVTLCKKIFVVNDFFLERCIEYIFGFKINEVTLSKRCRSQIAYDLWDSSGVGCLVAILAAVTVTRCRVGGDSGGIGVDMVMTAGKHGGHGTQFW